MSSNTTNLGASSPLPEGGKSLAFRSSGPPPAGRARQGEKHPPGPASRWRPLSSNVRPHVNTNLADTFFGASGYVAAEFEHWHRVASPGIQALCLVLSKLQVCCAVSETQSQMAWQHSMSATNLPSKLAQAARPVAGGSPSAVRYGIQELVSWHFPAALWVAGRRVVLLKSHCASATSHCPRSTERQKPVRPNPSLEPTRSGMAPWPRGFHAYHPPRGQGTTPPRSAHLKR